MIFSVQIIAQTRPDRKPAVTKAIRGRKNINWKFTE